MNKKKLIKSVIVINNFINENTSISLDKPVESELSNYDHYKNNVATYKVGKVSKDKGHDVLNIKTQLTSLKLVSRNLSAGLLTKIKSDMVVIYNKLKHIYEDLDHGHDKGIPFVDRNLIAELSEMIKLLSTILIYLPWVNAGKLLFKLKNILPIVLDVYKKNTVKKTNLFLLIDQVGKINIILNNISLKDRELAAFNV